MSESSLEVLNLVAGKNFILLPMSRIIKLFAFLTGVSFVLTLILGCSYTFTCSSFTPSPHYLGSFLGFNRFYVMSFVLLTVTLSLLYIGIYLEVKSQCSEKELKVLQVCSLMTCAILPLIALTNEVNSSHFISFTFAYSALAYLALVLNVAWLALVTFKLRQRVNMRSHLTFCGIWFIGLITLWVLVLIERDQNYKTENWFIKTSIWSALEWIFLAGKLLFLCFLSNFTRSFKILIGHSKKDSTTEDSIELGEIKD